MFTLLVAFGSFVGFIIAYHTYGRWLARKIFGLNPEAVVPSHELRDNVDYVPTHKQIIFGHHFTSIAGTGPIVGPAIAVFWGWLPALLWVVFGCIFIGAVHDLGSLVVSMRNRGQTVGEIAGRLITPRARILFLLILFFSLTVVLAIFGLVIANIFRMYPESVLSVWLSLPLAMIIGYLNYKRGGHMLAPSIISLMLLYVAVYVGVNYLPIAVTEQMAVDPATGVAASTGLIDVTIGVAGEGHTPWKLTGLPLVNPVVAWTSILMVYCFIASVLPVWLLLQPRDYINSHQLLVALTLILAGLAVAGLTGKADLADSAPAVVSSTQLPKHTPPIWPFLFITIACGACSGFHCLVSSGTTSKQVANEADAQYVAYGSMLLEGALAVLVIVACTAGVGMGAFEKGPDGVNYVQRMGADGQPLVGAAAWTARYNPAGDWDKFGLGATVGAFVEGGANLLTSLGLPLRLAVGLIATLVACFAATTLDTATRLQRYVIQELGSSAAGPLRIFTNKFAATGLAVGLALFVALLDGPAGRGSGGMMLWPLFGATNQLLAGLAFMVVMFYLWRRNKPVWFLAIPLVAMVIMPAWALLYQMFHVQADPTDPGQGWFWQLWSMVQGQQPWSWHNDHLLFFVGMAALLLQIWMVIEGILIWSKARGVLEPPLPPLPARPTVQPATAGGH